MIKIRYEHLITTHIQQTLQRLGDAQAFSPKVAYQIHKILTAVVKERLQALKQYEALAEYASKDANGKPERTNTTGEFVVPDENKEAYEAALHKLFDTEIALQHSKIELSHFSKVHFSPREMASLEPILEGLDEGDVATTPSLTLAR